jgi:hypothetical protein
MVSWSADQKEVEFKQLFNAVLNWTVSFMKLINMPGKVLKILMPAQCVSIAEDMNVWNLFCKYGSSILGSAESFCKICCFFFNEVH